MDGSHGTKLPDTRLQSITDLHIETVDWDESDNPYGEDGTTFLTTTSCNWRVTLLAPETGCSPPWPLPDTLQDW